MLIKCQKQLPDDSLASDLYNTKQIDGKKTHENKISILNVNRRRLKMYA